MPTTVVVLKIFLLNSKCFVIINVGNFSLQSTQFYNVLISFYERSLHAICLYQRWCWMIARGYYSHDEVIRENTCPDDLNRNTWQKARHGKRKKEQVRQEQVSKVIYVRWGKLWGESESIYIINHVEKWQNKKRYTWCWELKIYFRMFIKYLTLDG